MSAQGVKPSAQQTSEAREQAPVRAPSGSDAALIDHRLAHIDIEGLQAAGIPTPMGGRDRTVDEYRLIKRAILQNAAADLGESRRNLVMVTSTQPDEGKTFTSISLAMSVVAEAETEVLLVDLDIAKQDVCRRLGIERDIG